MLEILPELMGQLMSVQTCFSRAVFRAMLSGCLHTPRHLQGVGDQFPWKEPLEQCRLDVCTLPDTSREWGTSFSGRNLQSNVIQTSAHSQTPPGSGGPVALEGISRTMSSRCLHTPRHLQGVGDQLLQRESPEQCRPDVCTLLDTSREWGTRCSRGNLRNNVVRTSEHSQTPPWSGGPVALEGSPEQCRLDICTLPDTSREWGTSSPGGNLWNNVIRTSAHSQTPPGSGGPVAPEGISGAMSSGHLHTPRHLQGVGDQLLQKESLKQCHLDICTLPDTSREWGTRSSRRNLQKESPEQCHPDICTLPDTSRECGTSSSRLHLQKTDFWSHAHFNMNLDRLLPILCNTALEQS